MCQSQIVLKSFVLALCFFKIADFAFDPTKINYCNIPCRGQKNYQSGGCYCKLGPSRQEIGFDNPVPFRTAMVQAINEYRNIIASGLDEDLPTAAGMMAISYDLELEYLARCFARRYNGTGGELGDMRGDRCSVMSNKRIPSMVIAGSSNPIFDPENHPLEWIFYW